MLLTDSHCHIDFDTFSGDIERLLKQCYQQKIHRIINPAVSPNNWDTVLTLSQHPNILSQPTCQVFPCLGIHPWYLHNISENYLEQLTKKVAKYSQYIVAIGETGLDKIIAETHNNLDKQITFFEHQLSLSDQYNLPVIVHHRRSHELIIPILKKYKLLSGGVIHAFSGSYQQAKSYIDLGFKIGIGGTITYARAQKTINAIKKLPLSSLLLETDAPSMPLAGFQGEDNSPLQLTRILECLVQIRPESEEVITQTIENNVQSLFFNRKSKALSTKAI